LLDRQPAAPLPPAAPTLRIGAEDPLGLVNFADKARAKRIDAARARDRASSRSA
jgi:hypothetical protein